MYKIIIWKKEYNEWLKNNEHLPDDRKKTADEILEMPRPKSEPPKPPNVNSTDEELEKWSKEYTKWKDENEHLPNLQPVEVVLKNFKQRQQQMQQRQTSQEKDVSTKLIKRVDTLEKKLDKLMKHLGVK